MDTDVRLRLLKGEPIPLGRIGYIYLPSLGEITEIGYENFLKYMNTFTMNESTIEKAEMSYYSFLVEGSKINDDLKELASKSMSFFLRKEVKYSKAINAFYVLEDNNEEQKKKTILIDEDSFNFLKKIVKLQVDIEGEDVTEDNPANEKAKELLRKKREAKEKVARAKQKHDHSEPLDLADLVSILSVNSNINILQVWDLNLYVFYNQFRRLQLLDEYETSLKALFAGAKSDKVDLKDWRKHI